MASSCCVFIYDVVVVVVVVVLYGFVVTGHRVFSHTLWVLMTACFI